MISSKHIEEEKLDGYVLTRKTIGIRECPVCSVTVTVMIPHYAQQQIEKEE